MPQIDLDQETYKRIMEYAKKVGKEVSSVANEAVNDWLDVEEDPDFEAACLEDGGPAVLKIIKEAGQRGISLSEMLEAIDDPETRDFVEKVVMNAAMKSMEGSN